jgi:membrane protein required for colicin V production
LGRCRDPGLSSSRPRPNRWSRNCPCIGEFLAESCELSIIASFAAVFALGLVVMSLFTPLFSSAVQRSVLGGLDQGLGFLFGVLRGVLLVAVAFIVYDRAVATDTVPMVDDSRSAKIFASFQDGLNSAIPDDAPGWIVGQYEQLVGELWHPGRTRRCRNTPRITSRTRRPPQPPRLTRSGPPSAHRRWTCARRSR